METLKPTVEVTLKGNNFKIGYPTIGEYIEIEGLKQAITKGRYAVMALSPMSTARKSLDLVDAISFLSVLIGEPLFKMYKVNAVNEMLNISMQDAEDLLVAYGIYEAFYESISPRTDRETKTQQAEKGSVKVTAETISEANETE